LGDQVADMAVRGQDGEVLAQVLVDRLGLGRRFDDEEVLGHGGWACPCSAWGGVGAAAIYMVCRRARPQPGPRAFRFSPIYSGITPRQGLSSPAAGPAGQPPCAVIAASAANINSN